MPGAVMNTSSLCGYPTAADEFLNREMAAIVGASRTVGKKILINDLIF
jgi:hypothetical protein